MNEHTEPLREPVARLVQDPSFNEIIATKFINQPGGPWRTVIGWDGLQTKGEQEIAVPLPGYSRIVEKATYGMPLPTIHQITSNRSPGEIFVAGLETDVCVAICAAQLFDHGGAPYVISDCTGTTRGSAHQEHALTTLRRIVGRTRLISSDMISSL